MCYECGCESVGSATGIVSVEMEESSQHEMSEPRGPQGQDID